MRPCEWLNWARSLLWSHSFPCLLTFWGTASRNSVSYLAFSCSISPSCILYSFCSTLLISLFLSFSLSYELHLPSMGGRVREVCLLLPSCPEGTCRQRHFSQRFTPQTINRWILSRNWVLVGVDIKCAGLNVSNFKKLEHFSDFWTW